MATANAAGFDGATSLQLGADFTSNADSGLWSWSLYLKRSGGLGSQQRIYANLAERGHILWTTGNLLSFRFAHPADSTLVLRIETSAITDTTNWKHYCGSVDMSDAAKRHLLVDGTPDLNVVTYTTGETLDFTRLGHAIGASEGATPAQWYSGDMALFWCKFGTYIDFSIAANVQVFRTSGGKVPAPLAASPDGNVGGFGQPTIFLNNPFSSFETNLGSGGGFTPTGGTLTEVTGPEIGGIQILRRRREYVGAF